MRESQRLAAVGDKERQTERGETENWDGKGKDGA